MNTESSGPVTFEAVIVPHRSLGRRGLRWLLVSLALLSAGVSAGFWYLGAWPVIGFSGGEVLLAGWLLRCHARGTERTEMILLSPAGLRVVHTGRGGRLERTLPARWLRAGLEERPGRTPALWVRGPDGAVEVGAALGDEEKRELADALTQALQRQRSPVFDNELLRDEGTLSPRSGPST